MVGPVARCWWLYVIRCRDGELYAGISTDVERRLGEHRAGKSRAARYLRGRGPLNLVARWAVGEHGTALRCEHHFKALDKSSKEHLITAAPDRLPARLRVQSGLD